VLVPAVIDSAEAIAKALAMFAKVGATGLVDITAGAMSFIVRDQVAALAIEHGLAMFGSRPAADAMC
jgi:hypothetical protein